MEREEMFKIVEAYPGGFRTLFHGTQGSRNLVTGTWLLCDEKDVRDRSGAIRYRSGWHVFKTQEIAEKYRDRFTTRLDKLFIVPCTARNLRPKPTNPEVFLAEEIFFQPEQAV